jgi:hypothetical protein
MDDVGSEKLGSWSDSCNAEKLELERSSCFMWHDVPLLIGRRLKGKRSAETSGRGSRITCFFFTLHSRFQRDLKRGIRQRRRAIPEKNPTCIMQGLQG